MEFEQVFNRDPEKTGNFSGSRLRIDREVKVQTVSFISRAHIHQK